MTPTQETERKETMTAAHHDFAKGLNAYAFFKVHDHAIGEDLVQDTFMKTWKYLVKGGKVGMMKAFLYHVLNHLIVDQYRKRSTSSLDVLVEKGFEPGEDDSARMFNVLDGKAAVLLIERLPIAYRMVMNMRYIQDLSLAEMSVITGKSKNTMSVQVHRGLTKLKVLYNLPIEGGEVVVS